MLLSEFSMLYYIGVEVRVMVFKVGLHGKINIRFIVYDKSYRLNRLLISVVYCR
jgi:hypothetical protein